MSKTSVFGAVPRYAQVWSGDGHTLPPPAAFGCKTLLQMVERVAGDVLRVERRASGEVLLHPATITREGVVELKRLEQSACE